MKSIYVGNGENKIMLLIMVILTYMSLELIVYLQCLGHAQVGVLLTNSPEVVLYSTIDAECIFPCPW